MNKSMMLAATGLLFSSVGAMAKNVPNRPNIIFILADDMGIGDLGCYGQEQIATPHIDQLAKEGMLFTNHYSGSTVSAPSRCSLLTGKHTGTSYVRGNKGDKTPSGFFDLPLPKSEITVAEVLQKKGYATMCVGKWGLGGPQTSGSPMKKGFDYFYGYLGQGAAHRYYPDYLYENEEKVFLGGKVYSHFEIMKKGLHFLEENVKKPIFAYFAITPPHADLDYPDLSQYEGRFQEKPFINKSKNGKGYKTQMKPRACYAAMVTEVDNNVGQIIDKLKELGIYDNSIIIFSSDNGVHNVGGHDPDYFKSHLDFRGWKRDLYEGGIRTPFVLSWKGVVQEGTTTDHIATFWDFLPTMCDIVGASVPSKVNGISYLPTLLGETKSQKKHDYIYYEFYEMGGKQSIMDKEGWKLVRLNLSTPEKIVEELYFIPKDRSETQNLIAQHPEIADRLRHQAMKMRTESKHFSWNKQSESED